MHWEEPLYCYNVIGWVQRRAADSPNPLARNCRVLAHPDRHHVLCPGTAHNSEQIRRPTGCNWGVLFQGIRLQHHPPAQQIGQTNHLPLLVQKGKVQHVCSIFHHNIFFFAVGRSSCTVHCNLTCSKQPVLKDPAFSMHISQGQTLGPVVQPHYHASSVLEILSNIRKIPCST